MGNKANTSLDDKPMSNKRAYMQYHGRIRNPVTQANILKLGASQPRGGRHGTHHGKVTGNEDQGLSTRAQGSSPETSDSQGNDRQSRASKFKDVGDDSMQPSRNRSGGPRQATIRTGHDNHPLSSPNDSDLELLQGGLPRRCSRGVQNNRDQPKRKKRNVQRTSSAMETVAGAVDLLAQATSQSMVRDKKKSSLFLNWTTKQYSLFKMLSLEQFQEDRGLPKLNGFAKKITKGKKLQRTIEWIRWEAQSWDGCSNDSGISQWYAAGFFNLEYDFSVFNCVPHDYNGDKMGRSEEDRKENFQEVFGDGKLSDKTLQRFARLNLFLPKDTREAEGMLCIAVAWLKLVKGEESIATEPYQWGLHFLSRNCQVI